MTKEEKELDSVVRRRLLDRLGKDRFDLWFGRGVQWKQTDDALVICAESFSSDRLRAMFQEELRSVARFVVGPTARIEFEVAVALIDDDDSRNDDSRTNPSQIDSNPAKPKHTEARREPKNSSSGATRRARFATLKQFVVGRENRLAYTAAESTMEQLGTVSPLFLWGPPGTGKTHLLQGMWNVAQRRSGQRALYLTAEQFTSMFIEALQGSGLPNFRHKCRNVDLLLIDDVHFFANKRATLVELQHTLDALNRDGRQMVLAADRSPAELSQLGPELAMRMSGGLVCAVHPSDFDTRLEIARRFAAKRQLQLADEILQFVASELPGDARQIGGALNQLVAVGWANDGRVSVDLAHDALTDMISATSRVVRLRDIDKAVCDVFGLQPQTLQSTRRAKVVSQPRMLAMWLARKYTSAVYAEIGEYFGRRSHSTVISAHKTVEDWKDRKASIAMSGNACHVDEAIRRVESKLRLA